MDGFRSMLQSRLTQQINSPRSRFYATWRLRLLLALMLLFGSEILLWTDPLGRMAAEWMPLIVGYIVLASLLLDLASRFRARNIFGMLALAGIYGLLSSLLLNPDSTLTDVPRTLFTRVLGAHTFAGLVMLALFLRLTTPAQMPLLTGAAAGGLVGLGWGTWARWSPTLLRADAPDTPFTGMIALALLVIVPMLALLLLRRENAPPDLRLQPLGGLGVGVVLIALLVVRALNNAVDMLSFVLIVTLLGFCLVLLWFLKRKKGRTLLDGIGMASPSLTKLLVFIASFAALALASYGLPRGQGAQDPVFLITVLLTAFGIAWLPGVSLALGAQAVARQVRAGKL